MSTRDSDHFETKAIHAGQQPDPTTGAVMTPVYLTSTYAQSGPGERKGFEYSRTRNPTRDALQGCLAALESGKHGLAFASGLAATDAVLHLLSSGDHVVLSDDLYGGTFRLADKVFKRLGIEQTYVDVADARAVEAAFRPNTKLLWVETPTNPMLKICDLAALAQICRKRGVISVCDNTFATPFFQRPLELGFDIVAHSMTKSLNGHSDVVARALVLRRDDLHEKLAFLPDAVGAVPGPLDCFLALRGLKTLHIRMERHAQAARHRRRVRPALGGDRERAGPGRRSGPGAGARVDGRSRRGGAALFTPRTFWHALRRARSHQPEVHRCDGRTSGRLLDDVVGPHRQPAGELRDRVPLALPGARAGTAPGGGRTDPRPLRRGLHPRRTAGRATL